MSLPSESASQPAEFTVLTRLSVQTNFAVGECAQEVKAVAMRQLGSQSCNLGGHGLSS